MVYNKLEKHAILYQIYLLLFTRPSSQIRNEQV